MSNGFPDNVRAAVQPRWLLAIWVAFATPVYAGAGPSTPAPEFTLPARAGSEVSLSSLKGQVVLINFWATWCGPCRTEMPLLDQLYQRYKPLGFTLLGVNVEEDSSLADGFLKQTPVSFPVLLDAGDSISTMYRVRGYPTSFFVDRGGTVAIEQVGMMSDTQLADNLAQLGLGE